MHRQVATTLYYSNVSKYRRQCEELTVKNSINEKVEWYSSVQKDYGQNDGIRICCHCR